MTPMNEQIKMELTNTEIMETNNTEHSPDDCPICFETLSGNTNHINTQCGHQFHASCLMRNITHNGFACPCCRTVMAEFHEDSDDESDDDSVSDDESESGQERYGEYALRGFRLFTNRLEGREHALEDTRMENIVEVYHNYNGQGERPTIQYITEKLQEQGITYLQLVSALLADHEEYEMSDITQDTASDLWGKFRVIISNEIPEEQEEQEQEQQQEPEQQQEQEERIIVNEKKLSPLTNLDDIRAELRRFMVNN
jgi:hypothetical protein